MMVFTAKVKKKNLIILGAAILAILLVILWPGKKDAGNGTPPAEMDASQNEDRVRFLESFGWQVSPEPAETGSVRVPEEENEIFTRYNALQKSQGYDLAQYAGKVLKRYVYEVLNGSQDGEACRATLFVYKNRIVGGDVSCAGPEGKMHGFRMP